MMVRITWTLVSRASAELDGGGEVRRKETKTGMQKRKGAQVGTGAG
jgi:hypothetical protein